MRVLPGLADAAPRHRWCSPPSPALRRSTLALGSLEFEARIRPRRVAARPRLLYVPLIVPQVAFLFGLQILFTVVRARTARLPALALVHLVFVFPYVLLSLSDPWRNWDPRYGHVMHALGRGPDAVFWLVRLPMLVRAGADRRGASASPSRSALYLPTLLIGAGRWPTVTTETVALASGGDRRLVGAVALVQALLPFLGFAVAAIVPPILFRHRRLLRSGA